MKEVMYLLVPFEEVKDIFHYARVVQGKALLQLAQIRYLKGVTGIEVIGGHEADIMIAEQEEMERNGLGDVGQNDGGGEEPAPEESEPGPEGEQSSEEAPDDGCHWRPLSVVQRKHLFPRLEDTVSIEASGAASLL